MKILIATGIYPPDIGGPATYVEHLRKELPAYNFDIEILTYGEPQGKQMVEGTPVYKVSRKHNVLQRYSRYFVELLKRVSKFDLVYVQGPAADGIPTFLACTLLRKKYILKVVGDYAWEHAQNTFHISENLDEFQNAKFGWKTELLRTLQKMVARGAEKIVVPSEYLKKIVGDGWGISKEKIQVIYNAVEIKELLPEKEQIRRDLGIDGFALVSVGRLVSWKSFPFLIEVAAELKKEIPGLSLRIIGEGQEYQKLQDAINACKANDFVYLLGSLPREKTLQYIAASDAFLLNTSYEGLSHVLIEAASVSTPIITTNVGGNPEVVENNVSGVLISWNDKNEWKNTILSFYKNRDMSTQFAIEAKRGLFRFTKKQMIEGIVHLLQSLNIKK